MGYLSQSLGTHQMINATTALGAMEVLEDLGYPVSNDAMMEGLREVEWPGRLEMVCSSPRVILDGAHNPAGALVLKESLEKEFRYRPSHSSHRDHEGQGYQVHPPFLGPLGRSHHSHPAPVRTALLPRPYSKRHWDGMERKRRSSKISRRRLTEVSP